MTAFVCLILVFLIAVSFLIGVMVGKRSRKITLKGLGAHEAFAYFLSHEIYRHQKDIEKARADLRNIVRRGIVPPDLPLGLWIEVKK